MHWKTMAACIGLTVIANAVSAQVHRCKDPSGNITYSEIPCSGAKTGEQIQRARSREEVLEERLRVAEENERKANSRAKQAERASASDSRVPQERNVHITYRDDTPDKSKSAECLSAKKELEFSSSVQSLSTDDKRFRMNAATTNVRMSCR